VGIAINHAANILPTRKALLQQPACSQCNAPYKLFQWSALLAWIKKEKECHQCGSPQKTFGRSIVVELALPVFFVFLALYYGFSIQLVLGSIYTAVLILITVTDLEHRLIFHRVTIPAIIFAGVASLITPGLSWRQALLGGGLGLILTYGIWLFGVLFYGQGAFGVGDITLATLLGLILGFPQILMSLIFGVFFGGIVALLLIIFRRSNRRAYIPYGPFLTITGWIMLIWGNEIWNYFY